jgi:hypothetical protein
MRPCLHFVGLRGDEYWRAVRVFGRPDFIHDAWDITAAAHAAPIDTVVFARGPADQKPRSFWR